MRLHRFMSKKEYESLIKGETLKNNHNHKDSGSKTESIGFCFFPEEPDKAIHWLRGIVTTEYCVTLDIPDSALIESWGIYRDPDNDMFEEGMGLLAALFMPVPQVKRKEYCLTEYSIQNTTLIDVTDKYAH